MNNENAIAIPFEIDPEIAATLTTEQQAEVMENLATIARAATQQTSDAPDVVAPDDSQLQQFQRDAMATLERRARERHDPMAFHKVIVRRGIATVDVDGCGHKLDHEHEPRHANCADCWAMYFKIHPGKLTAAKSIIETMGDTAIKNAYGKKFLKAVKRIINGE